MITIEKRTSYTAASKLKVLHNAKTVHLQQENLIYCIPHMIMEGGIRKTEISSIPEKMIQ